MPARAALSALTSTPVLTPAALPITQPSTAAGPTVNVKDYGASGSDNTYTCSIDAGSTTLTCTTPTDFQVGQYVAVPTASDPSPLTPVSSVTAAQLGTPGSTPILWALCTADPMGAISGCATSSISNGASTLSTANPVRLTFKRNDVNAALHLIYRKTGSGPWAFITVTNKSPWYDIGYTPTSFFGWPSTPTSQNQTLYAQIVSGSGTTWSLATAASNSATAVTVMHDDSAAVQAAASTCAMKRLYFPVGTYHLTRPQFYNFMTQQFYSTFAASTPNYPNLYAQGIVQIPSNCTIIGAGRSGTILATDRMGNSAGHENLFGLNTGGHNNPFNIKPAPVTYALNNASQGATVVVTTKATDAGNFARNDYVLTYGGAPIASPYVSSEINQVVSANPATGAIVLSNALQKPLPFGTVGTPPAIIKLNGNIIHDDDFSDMTIKTPNGIWFNTSAVFHVHTERIDQPIYTVSDLWYGGFRRDWTNENNNFVSQGQELDMDEDFAFRGGSWFTFGNGIVFDEASSTGIFDKTIIAYNELLCSTGVTCTPGASVGVAIGSQLNVFNLAITNSTIGATCNSANDFEALRLCNKPARRRLLRRPRPERSHSQQRDNHKLPRSLSNEFAIDARIELRPQYHHTQNHCRSTLYWPPDKWWGSNREQHLHPIRADWSVRRIQRHPSATEPNYADAGRCDAQHGKYRGCGSRPYLRHGQRSWLSR